MSDQLNIADISNRFEGIDPSDGQGNRRPHRPLLVLYALGRLEHGERWLSYDQIDRDVGELLKRFGPPHSTSPRYPFWYLRSDDVWEVEDAAELPRRSGQKEPLVSAMRERNTRGRFPDDVWTALQESPQLRYDVARFMLDKSFPFTLHQDILDAVGLNTQPRYYASRQPKRNSEFRSDVLEAYDWQCAVCGFDLTAGDESIGLEAAHIRWHQYNGPDVVSNGIALCALHHKMLDKGAIHITVESRLLVFEGIHGSSPHIDRLREKHGRKIHVPGQTESPLEERYVTWHVREVFRGEYGEA